MLSSGEPLLRPYCIGSLLEGVYGWGSIGLYALAASMETANRVLRQVV